MGYFWPRRLLCHIGFTVVCFMFQISSTQQYYLALMHFCPFPWQLNSPSPIVTLLVCSFLWSWQSFSNFTFFSLCILHSMLQYMNESFNGIILALTYQVLNSLLDLLIEWVYVKVITGEVFLIPCSFLISSPYSVPVVHGAYRLIWPVSRIQFL